MEFRRCDVVEIIPIRHAVLRPGRPVETAHFDHDLSPGTLHFGAFNEDGRAEACLTLLKQPFPDTSIAEVPDTREPAWQLRGMATSEQIRGSGAGSALMRFALNNARQEEHATLFWCNARESAVPFYQKNGWKVVSDVFDVPGIGPHYRMLYRLR